ncbi:hypothetical protein BRC81_11275 [Halobacteriales archaeon QS_1_68_20]|nr:MAG: hypothetical protein BRC81_11275 [Halobacteriales archaeon QS_1_68_20]
MSRSGIRSTALGIATRLDSVPTRLLLVGLLMLVAMAFGADPVAAESTCEHANQGCNVFV